MKNVLVVFSLFLSMICLGQNDVDLNKKKTQEFIIEEFTKNCAYKYDYNYQMDLWQDCLDLGLKKDSTIAYLWQQKAMPYFKARKYEVGLPLIDKAVYYDRINWQPYRAFIKCIFIKNYKEAIIDFEDCKKRFGNGFVMDHTYNFYIALSYLQLNEYEKAEILLLDYTESTKNKLGEDWVHPTALFYLGVAQMERKKLSEAIATFNRALKLYPQFSDVKYYKAVCITKINGSQDEVNQLIEESKSDAKLGYTINEDNIIYETYPYQKKWRN